MALSLSELLLPQAILKVVSLVRRGQGRLGRWLGFQPQSFDSAGDAALGGPNTVNGQLRYATFRIFNYSRVPAKMRAPGTGPAVITTNPVGEQQIGCARAHEKVQLLYELLGNLSPIIGPNSVIDQMGQNYISRQIQIMGQHFNVAIEMMAAGMMRNSLYFIQEGDNWIPSFAAPTGSQVGFQVPFQIPSTSTGQGANLLGSGAAGSPNIIDVAWNNPAAQIFRQLCGLLAAYEALHGYVLQHGWLNSLLMYYLVTNTEIRQLAGTAATPYAEYDYVDETFYDGYKNPDQALILKAAPWITWHATNEVVAVGTTGNVDIDPVNLYPSPNNVATTKVVPDNMCIFAPEPDNTWTELYLGAEPVVENPGMPAVLRSGYYFWNEYRTQPSCVELIGLLNAVPLLYVPKVLAPLTVVF
jgi:hypothetical protein